jgi:hypothetical protein
MYVVNLHVQYSINFVWKMGWKNPMPTLYNFFYMDMILKPYYYAHIGFNFVFVLTFARKDR